MIRTHEPLLGRNWRIAGWASAAGLLALPAVAMLLTGGVDWTVGDFAAAGLLLGSLGIGLELALRTSRSWPRFLGIALAAGTAFLTVWSNLAIGILGNEADPVNSLFFVVLFVGALLGAFMRFRSRPMARIAALMAASQFAIGIYATEYADRAYVEWGVLCLFAGLWSAVSLLLNRATRD
ncbi:hypothetical protein E3U23_13285 [Erythrobacter litoralis]|uniref:hypothetical protein n=1 Tax=Erythrobacter litoralis TaxID=39960 RepID=UPI0024359C6B|nr:hypothetical protein [Erythrobacter litoralis]MDG6080162.1 hypothetical protein [Erythrobacter litoralis]